MVFKLVYPFIKKYIKIKTNTNCSVKVHTPYWLLKKKKKTHLPAILNFPIIINQVFFFFFFFLFVKHIFQVSKLSSKLKTPQF